jgi:uncharacterized protein YdeI (YjbR/CyaY-like superfamily)
MMTVEDAWNMPANSLALATTTAWHAWLEEHHALEPEVWLLLRKRGSKRPLLTLPGAVEEALCFGWVDSVLHPVDSETYALRFSPRRAGSIWAATNVRRVALLISQGRMTEAGLAAVREAQANGAWDAALRLEDPCWLPDDLRLALDGDESARARWEQVSPSTRKQYVGRITGAKRSTTRARRIAETLRRLREG